MLRLIRCVMHFLATKSTGKNCSPVCPTCEVEIAEGTANAISSMIDKRINKMSGDQDVIEELQTVRKMINDGEWHYDYDAHFCPQK